MSKCEQEQTVDLSFAELDRIDQACDRLEAAWKAGVRPRIEEYLAEASPLERATLLRDLLVVELHMRRRAGELPNPPEYLQRFPDHDDIATIVSAFIRHGTAPPRFIDQELHARGGLGAVYKAHDEELNRVVAIKKIRDDRACDSQSRARFLREAEITGRLEHPGIAPVYSLSRDDDARPYYAMRFVRGQTLHEAISRFHDNKREGRDRGELTLVFRGLLQRFIDVCNKVDYAHTRGILHRDLKPDNVMLGSFGETVVLDWGLARPIDAPPQPGSVDPPITPTPSSDPSDTQPGSCVGTPRYMSPEQAAGVLDRMGYASDVYSLGASLYHLLTGQPPFKEVRETSALLEMVQAGAFRRHAP